MSQPLHESDHERRAREAATIAVGTDAHGEPALKLLLIDHAGHLSVAIPGTKLKPGWRYGTRADYERKLAEEAARQAEESGELDDEPAPLPPAPDAR